MPVIVQQPNIAVREQPRRRIWPFVAAALLIAAALLGDRYVDPLARGRSNSGWLWLIAHDVSKFGDWPYLLLAGLAVAMCGRFLRRPMLARLGVALALSSCLAGLAATAIRSVTGRTRPSATVAQGWYGIRHDSQWLVGKYDYNSFPSGHTGAAAGFAVALFLGTRRGKLPAVLLVLLMGWSRVYLGAHHLSDVVAAAVVGTAVGVVTCHKLVPKIVGQGSGEGVASANQTEPTRRKMDTASR